MFNIQSRNDAKSGIKDVDKLRELVKQLICFEGQMHFVESLRTAELILKVCPYYKVALISRANALCELQRYVEAKSHIETAMLQSHESILSLYKHKSGKLPFPNLLQLDWRENKKNSLEIDTDYVVNAILCMGSDFASIYVITLKNAEANRTCSGLVMEKLSNILGDLLLKLTAEDLAERWSWLPVEEEKILSLMNLKISADQHFKSLNYKAALHNYANALKVCRSLILLCAPLLVYFDTKTAINGHGITSTHSCFKNRWTSLLGNGTLFFLAIERLRTWLSITFKTLSWTVTMPLIRIQHMLGLTCEGLELSK